MAIVVIVVAGVLTWSLTRSSDGNDINDRSATDLDVSNPGSPDQIFADLGVAICGSEVPISEDDEGLFRGATRQAVCQKDTQSGWFGVYDSATALDTMLNSLNRMDAASYVPGDQWIAMNFGNNVATSLQDDGGGTLLSCN